MNNHFTQEETRAALEQVPDALELDVFRTDAAEFESKKSRALTAGRAALTQMEQTQDVNAENPHQDYLRRYWQMGFDGISLGACTGDAPMKAWREGSVARTALANAKAAQQKGRK